MLISVTAEDIKAGKRGNCEKCPIALALIRSLGNPTEATISVNQGFVQLWPSNENLQPSSFDLPEYARSFIYMFDWDYEEDIKPFSFSLSKDDLKAIKKSGIKIPAKEKID
jgi:hypothetical protein